MRCPVQLAFCVMVAAGIASACGAFGDGSPAATPPDAEVDSGLAGSEGGVPPADAAPPDAVSDCPKELFADTFATPPQDPPWELRGEAGWRTHDPSGALIVRSPDNGGATFSFLQRSVTTANAAKVLCLHMTAGITADKTMFGAGDFTNFVDLRFRDAQSSRSLYVGVGATGVFVNVRDNNNGATFSKNELDVSQGASQRWLIRIEAGTPGNVSVMVAGKSVAEFPGFPLESQIGEVTLNIGLQPENNALTGATTLRLDDLQLTSD